MNLLSWDYPAGNSLKSRVDNYGEYPITCLTTLSDQDKRGLLKAQCILVRDLVRNPKQLKALEVDKVKEKNILDEAKSLLIKFD